VLFLGAFAALNKSSCLGCSPVIAMLGIVTLSPESSQHLYNMKEWKVMATTTVITQQEVDVETAQLEGIEGEREQSDREAEWGLQR
jgi:hypothetical protein